LVCGICASIQCLVFSAYVHGLSCRHSIRRFASSAAGIAGYIWGGAILDSSHVKTYGQSIGRGLGVNVGAYVIFAALYACELPLLEGQWSLGRVGSLFLFTLILGILMGGPLAAVTGMTAAVTLFKFGRHLIVQSGGRVSETSIV
jgi:hypothetical protein